MESEVPQPWSVTTLWLHFHLHTACSFTHHHLELLHCQAHRLTHFPVLHFTRKPFKTEPKEEGRGERIIPRGLLATTMYVSCSSQCSKIIGPIRPSGALGPDCSVWHCLKSALHLACSPLDKWAKEKTMDWCPSPWLTVLKCFQRGLHISVLLGCCSCGFGGAKGMTERTARCHPSAGGTPSSNGREGVCCSMEVAVSKMLTLVGCGMLRRYFLLLHFGV